MKFCIKCGCKGLPAARFCAQCGVAVPTAQKHKSSLTNVFLVAPAVIVAGILMVMIAVVVS